MKKSDQYNQNWVYWSDFVRYISKLANAKKTNNRQKVP
jgi:hypothetical protein